nr:epidermis-specific secreted glycoprotein EP1-like [Ipomoea batatas]GMC56628.1 epidermis-specific secreted glycoprotein EP1-like [Ipomoea batatas]
MSSSYSSTLIFLLVSIQILSCFAQVPAKNTFKLVNEGELGPYVVEYRADYRVLDVFNNPFQLCFYNTTPNAYTLALRMGTVRSELRMRWVWEANRGRPVRDGATFELRKDGNLVLADVDGRVVWQSGTANKGVVGFKLLPNGNMVLHDTKGNFVWQSFDYPTDTLLVGQSLRQSGPRKLVSRASEAKNANGPYTMILEPMRLGFYNQTKNSGRSILYHDTSKWFSVGKSSLEEVKFNAGPQALKLDYKVAKSSKLGAHIMARPKFNTTLTYLRLEIDGNLKTYTFYSDAEENFHWGESFKLF